MKFILLFLSVAGCVLFVTSTSEKCDMVTQEDCENMTSEYETYRACMERRTKRSADCYDNDDDSETNCDKCDCNSCSYTSCDKCSSSCCSNCCQKSSCNSNVCCQQTCRAECRSNACRTSCKRKCQDRPDRLTPLQTQTSNRNENHHNITTVIHLNNVINNTNLINLPIHVNNTVLNNITNQGGYRGSNYQERENCCLTIGPRQCVSQSTFPYMRCFHMRKKACGNICSAPVVHYQSHEICDNDVNVQQPCRQQLVYIPQPQPRCAYQQNWPYVSCGNQGMRSCEGCYSHYVRREDVTKCSNFCYDDGYGVGPYYRQGPFYRPGFAHAPSCYQTGTCGYDGYSGYGYGYGYEGLPDYGLPLSYPPQTYPFVIEDCQNCTFSTEWDSPNPIEPIQQPSYKNLQTNAQLSQAADKLINIDATVNQGRNERYAEIRIKPTKKNKPTTTTVNPTLVTTTST